MRVPNVIILCVAGQLRDRFTVWVRIEYLNLGSTSKACEKASTFWMVTFMYS